MRIGGTIIIPDPIQDVGEWGVEMSINGGAYIALPDYTITDYTVTGTGEGATRVYTFRFTWADDGSLVVGDTLRFHFTPNRYDTGALGEFYYPAIGSDPIVVAEADIVTVNNSFIFSDFIF